MSLEKEIPEYWDYSIVKDYCKVNQINRNPEKEFPDKEFDYVTVSCVDGEVGKIEQTEKEIGKDAPSRAKREIHEGDVIVSTTRPYLRAFAIVPEELDGAICSTAFAVLTPGEDVLTKFLWYAVRFEDFVNQLKKKQRGASYPAVGIRDVKNSKIPVPPVDEQKAIVEKLDLIFENIEEIQDAQKHAKDIKESLGTSAYKSIFDDLIANYPIVEVENIADEIKNGGTPKRSEDSYWGGTIPWIKSGELNEGYISSSEEYLTDKGLNEGSAKLMDPGTVLIAMYGATRGKTAILQEEMTTNQAICGVLVNEDEIIPKFLQFCMKARKRELVNKGRGGGQDNINQTTIKETKIPLPPLNIQGEVLERIGNIENALKEEYSLQREEIVETLPNSVLAEAFKGDLVDFGATSESDELGSTEQGIREKQESSFDGEGQQSLGEYR